MKKKLYFIIILAFIGLYSGLLLEGVNAQQTKIGETKFDLQSNSAVDRRIVNYGDGTLSAIWCIANDFSPYSTRGTGYNYFDGTSWMPLVTTRLESFKTGLPSLGNKLFGGTREVIMPHDGTNFNTQLGKNTAKGSASFTFTTSGASVPLAGGSGRSSIYPRVAIGGPGDSTIHVVSTFKDSTDILMGVKSPVVYARSLDGGATWDKVNVTLPGYDSTRTLYGDVECYAIDASGNNVAIVMGGLGKDVTLWKSTDNGSNFTKMYVDSFPFAPDIRNYSSLDTAWCNDGSLTVLLDNNGKARVAYGLSRIFGGSNSGFFPITLGLIYADEINQTLVNIPILDADTNGILDASIDKNGNGYFDVGQNTYALNGSFGPAARYNNGSLLSKPSMAMDTSGNIYIIFSMPADGDSTADGQSYRDIWAVKSCNNGVSWGPPVNLTNSVGSEEAFASVAKLADNYLHIVYQQDGEPGTAALNADPDGINSVYYLKVSTSLIPSSTVTAAITASGSTTFCQGDSVTLTASGGNSYLWSNGDTTQSITVDSSGTYTVSATTGGCAVSSATTVTATPLPTAAYTVYPDTAVLHHWFVLNTASGTPPLTYYWSWGDGDTSGGATPSHTYSLAGYFQICLTVTDSAGCASTYCDSSTYIYKQATAASVSVILPPTGVTEQVETDNSISIFPNPVNDNLIIDFKPQNKNAGYEIYDVFGRVTLKSQILNPQSLIQVSELSEGLYMLRITDGESVYNKKFVKE